MSKMAAIYKVLMKSGSADKAKVGSKLMADYHRPAKQIAKQAADNFVGPGIGQARLAGRQTINQAADIPGHLKDIYKADGYTKSEKLKAILEMLKDNKKGLGAYAAGTAGLGAAGYGAKRAMSDDE